MHIKFLDHYALGVIFTPSVYICHLTLANNKMYFVLKFMDPSRRAIAVEEKYCVKLLAVTGLFFSLPSCHYTVIKESQDPAQRAMQGFFEGPEGMMESSAPLNVMQELLPVLLKEGNGRRVL